MDDNPPSPDASYNLGLTPIEVAQKSVIRINVALTLLPFLIASVIADSTLAENVPLTRGSVAIPFIVLAALVLVSLPHRKWRRWGFDMQTDRLRIVRGFQSPSDAICDGGG